MREISPQCTSFDRSRASVAAFPSPLSRDTIASQAPFFLPVSFGPPSVSSRPALWPFTTPHFLHRFPKDSHRFRVSTPLVPTQSSRRAPTDRLVPCAVERLAACRSKRQCTKRLSALVPTLCVVDGLRLSPAAIRIDSWFAFLVEYSGRRRCRWWDEQVRILLHVIVAWCVSAGTNSHRFPIVAQRFPAFFVLPLGSRFDTRHLQTAGRRVYSRQRPVPVSVARKSDPLARDPQPLPGGP